MNKGKLDSAGCPLQYCGMIYHTEPGEELIDPPQAEPGGRA